MSKINFEACVWKIVSAWDNENKDPSSQGSGKPKFK